MNHDFSIFCSVQALEGDSGIFLCNKTQKSQSIFLFVSPVLPITDS